MAGISSKALNFGGIENRQRFNNYEQQNKEFSDGSGLEWYDYKHRFYDNQIGRFFCTDELASVYPWYSQYQFAGNMPIRFIDLDGKEPAEAEGRRSESEPRTEEEVRREYERDRERNEAREAAEVARTREASENLIKRSTDEVVKNSEGANPQARGRFTRMELAEQAAARYFRNAFEAAGGIFGVGGSTSVADDVVSNSEAASWRVHQQNVTEALMKQRPNEAIGTQVTLDVVGPGGEVKTIIPDNMYKVNNQYQIVDAKFSKDGNLLTGSLRSSLTPNQKIVFDWIKNGQVQTAFVRGSNASAMGLQPGTNISLTNQVQVAVNIPKTSYNTSIYGAQSISFRTY